MANWQHRYYITLPSRTIQVRATEDDSKDKRSAEAVNGNATTEESKN